MGLELRPDPKPALAKKQPTVTLKPKRRKRTDPAVTEAWYVAVLAKTPVLFASTETASASAVLARQCHHIVNRQACRKHGAPEWDARNGVPVSKRRHERHHSRVEPIRRNELPGEVFEFAEEHGLGAWLDRMYPAVAA